MLELVYKADLESVANACEFESHYRHQILPRHQAVRYQTLTLTFTGSNPVEAAINNKPVKENKI